MVDYKIMAEAWYKNFQAIAKGQGVRYYIPGPGGVRSWLPKGGDAITITGPAAAWLNEQDEETRARITHLLLDGKSREARDLAREIDPDCRLSMNALQQLGAQLYRDETISRGKVNPAVEMWHTPLGWMKASSVMDVIKLSPYHKDGKLRNGKFVSPFLQVLEGQVTGDLWGKSGENLGKTKWSKAQIAFVWIAKSFMQILKLANKKSPGL